jgi:tyrosine-protein kinase Etk/Wzc
MSSGPLPPNPIEILMDKRTSPLIDQLRQQFDYIIMDAPPIGILSDAHALSEYAEVTLYLVRQKVTQLNQVGSLDQLAQTGNFNKMGIIVNDVVSKTYGSGYGYGDYGQEKPSGYLKRISSRFRNRS